MQWLKNRAAIAYVLVRAWEASVMIAPPRETAGKTRTANYNATPRFLPHGPLKIAAKHWSSDWLGEGGGGGEVCIKITAKVYDWQN